MKKPFKLLIAVPCMDYVHADFMKSLLNLCQHLQREGIRYHTEILSGTLIYLARNKLASKAVCENFTHILFLDSDMVFDETVVETLCFCGKPESGITPGRSLRSPRRRPVFCFLPAAPLRCMKRRKTRK